MNNEKFNDSLLKGQEVKFVVINKNDVSKYVQSSEIIESFNETLTNVSNCIEHGRNQDDKNVENSYIVINTDESYIDEVVEILKRHGHWG